MTISVNNVQEVLKKLGEWTDLAHIHEIEEACQLIKLLIEENRDLCERYSSLEGKQDAVCVSDIGNNTPEANKSATDTALTEYAFLFHEHILNNLSDGITVQDTDFNVIYQNGSMQSIFGNHIGEKCYAVYERRTNVCEGCGLEKAFCTGKPTLVLRTAFDNNGNTSFWENACFPIFNNHGKIIAGAEVCRNVSSRVSLEQEVKDRNIQLAQLNEQQKKQKTMLHEALERREKVEKELRHEIAERKRAQVELKHAKEVAEVATRMKSEFLANMSHEIRTPMSSIMGFTDLLMESNLNVSKRNNYLMVVRRNSEHLLHLINDILDLSKIEADKLLVNIEKCSLVSIMADVTSMMRPRADARGDTLSVEYVTELPETIHTDEYRLRQTIVNLVGNAIKFTENGKITIKVYFMPQWENEKPAIKIEVVDTGIGIRKEILPNLFQPFQQGDSSIAKRFGGTGLGLAISHHIVKLLDGEITAESVEGYGSTFAITIPTGDLQNVKILNHPADSAYESEPDVSAEKTNILSGVKVLLAEDGIDNQELIRMYLTGAGVHKVEIAENGAIAVEKAEKRAFDIILMDVNMPEMDGYEATRLLRSQGYNKPIVALTANAMAGDKELSLAAGCNEHLSKPIDRSLMIHTIAELVKKNMLDIPATQMQVSIETSSATTNDATTSATLHSAEPSQTTAEKSTVTATVEDDSIISLCINDQCIVPILDGYIQRLGGVVNDMKRYLSDGNFTELHRLAHRLKGSGSNYGYPALTEAAKILESAAKDGNAELSASSLDVLATIAQAVIRGYKPVA